MLLLLLLLNTLVNNKVFVRSEEDDEDPAGVGDLGAKEDKIKASATGFCTKNERSWMVLEELEEATTGVGAGAGPAAGAVAAWPQTKPIAKRMVFMSARGRKLK